MSEEIEQSEQFTPKKQGMLEALRLTMGVVTPALESAKVGRATFYSWLKKDKAFKAEVDAMKDIALDFAESKLYTAIKNGNMTATIFYLKTQGKARGYIEKHEVEQETTVKTQGNINLFLPDNGRNPHLTQGKIADSEQ